MLVRKLLPLEPAVIRVMDIDETRLHEMRHAFGAHGNIRYLVGDVRDFARLDKALDGVDLCFHLAALKHVWSCEYDPYEAVKTNVLSINNLVEIATRHRLKKVIYTSSDKAANPSSTMGATKLLGEKIIASAGYSTGRHTTRFASVRFGNVIASRGSIVPIWRQQIRQGGPLTITDPAMTRFMMSQEQAADLLLKCTHLARGGEVFILKMPALRLGDLLEAVQILYDPGKKTTVKVVGQLAGEKAYEELISEADCANLVELGEMYVLLPLIAEHYETHIRDFLKQRYKDYPELRAATPRHHRSDQHPLLAVRDIVALLKDSELVDGA